jgi:hypothetical protein
MAKFDPYEPKEITLQIKDATSGDVFDKITGTIQKISWRMRKNGYSDWNGVYYVAAYRFTYTRRGDKNPTVIEDNQRKSVISETIVRHADFLGLNYETRQNICRKGK